MNTYIRPHVLALALGLLAGTAHAGTPINETRPLDPRGRVQVSNIKGRIEVRTWNRPEVRITGTLGEGAERLRIDGGGSSLKVEARYPQRGGWPLGRKNTGEPTILLLTVPVRADLDITAVSADVLAWGVSPSRLRIENVSGRTTVAGSAEVAEIESVSGDLDITLNRANVDVQSVSGDIRLTGRLGREIEVESVSGSVDVTVLGTPLARFDATSVSGNLRMRSALAPRARVKLESVSGDVDLHLPPNVSADVRAESFSGSLRAPGASVERPRHGPGANLRHRYGGGDAEISVETFSGDAQIRLD